MSNLRAVMPIIVVLFTLLAGGFYLVSNIADSQKQQDIIAWEDRLNLVTNSRAADVSRWLNSHLDTVERLAGDATLQLYISMHTSGEKDVAEAQRGYVFSLLSAEADRSGFHEEKAVDDIAANVRRERRAGLAVISSTAELLVATSGMPQFDPAFLQKTPTAVITAGPVLEDRTPLVVFAAPIATSESHIGADIKNVYWVVGARPLSGDFLETLVQPGALSQTAETYIFDPFAADAERIIPLTPLRAGGRLGESRRNPAATMVLDRPGAVVTAEDYSGNTVMATGRELSAPVDWILIRSVAMTEILEAVNARRNTMLTTLSLVGLLIIIMLVLVWRHGVSRRLRQAYEEQSALSEATKSLSEFLTAVTDSQPTGIAAVDAKLTVRFCNRRMADITDIDRASLLGRRLDNAFEDRIARILRTHVQSAHKGIEERIELRLDIGDTKCIFDTLIIPLGHNSQFDAGALILMRDVTELMAAEQKSQRLLGQLVQTLAEIIDSRDPWSRHHSTRVADVSMALASELAWSPEATETARIAGQLVNIGKIFVPKAILIKETPLTKDELKLVRDSLVKGAGLLADLEFPGPVSKSLGQISERFDGSGQPDGLKGEDIEPVARLLAVANAFVGMVSARAHRKGLSMNEAMDALSQNAGTGFDRRIVAALQNVIENKGGRERWADFGRPIE